MALEEDLALNVGPAEQAVDRLGKLLEQQAKLFSSALGQAVQVLSGIPVTVDTSDVSGAIAGAVDAADTAVEVDGEAGDITAEIDGAVDAADTEVELEVDADEAERAVKGLNVSMGTLLKTAAAVAAIDFFKTGVESLVRIEQISLQTDARIKSTGAAANVTTQEIEALADSLERTTAAEAETTQEGANLLLTFTSIQNQVGAGNDIFDRAVVTMNDLSVVMGTDAKSSALQLGKALEDPTKGVSALARSGVSFSEDQKAMIASLQESGDLLGAQKLVLAQVEVQVKGAAEAYGSSLAGRVALAGHAFGTFQEEASAALLPLLEMGLDALPELLEALQPLLNSLADLGAAALPGVITSLHTLLPIIQLVGEVVALIPEDAVALGVALFAIAKATVPLAAGLTKVGVASSLANPAMLALTAAAAVAVTVMGDNAKAERERAAAIETTADALRNAEDAQEAYTDGIGELLTGSDDLAVALREVGVTQAELTQATLSAADAQEFANNIRERGVDLTFDETVALHALLDTQREGARAAFDGALATGEFTRAQADAAIIANQVALGEVNYAAALDDARDAADSAAKSGVALGKATEGVGVFATLTEEQLKEQAEGVKLAQDSVDNYVKGIEDALPKAAEAMQDLNKDGRVSIQEFTTTLQEQTLAVAAFPNTINTLFALGFEDLAAYLQKQGPEITAQFAADIDKGGPDVLIAANAALFDNTKAAADATVDLMLGPAGERVRAGALALGLNVPEGFEKGAEGLVGRAATAIAGARTGLDGEVTEWEGLGTDLTDGIGKGMLRTAATIAAVAARIVKAAHRAAELAAQANSPSRLFALLGEDMGDGVAMGLEAATRGVVAEAEAVLAAAAGVAVPTLGAAALGGGGTSIGQLTVAVNVSGTVSPEDATAIGERVGAGVLARLGADALLNVDFDSRIA